MARTDLTSVMSSMSGVDLTTGFTAANVDGHMFADHGRMVLFAKNTDGTAKQLLFDIPVLIEGQAVPDKQVTIPAITGFFLIGPFKPVYRQPNGKVNIDYSAVTGVSVKLVDLPAA
ncbi:hypothetical protein [Nonomuraea basaltis]|uniref:hypothetical protein n=1 Tax=Nonomuraea basaltis TaxID=2495887 RepID=UPI00110C50AB|nr:hypothetical protein [Nonomuraea basaltis]TMR97539.1 hypothetical protein EJK15_17620 [Nonomuraea basaltis]